MHPPGPLYQRVAPGANLAALEDLTVREERQLAIAANAAIVEQSKRRQMKAPADNVKTCPQCAEEVKVAAKVCRFCGHKFEGDLSTGAVSKPMVRLRTSPNVELRPAPGVRYTADERGYVEAAPEHVAELQKMGCFLPNPFRDRN